MPVNGIEHRALHVVLGAGPVGRAVASTLHLRGRRVRLVSRAGTAAAPEGVEVRAADVRDVAAATEACRGAAVVYVCLNAPLREWPEQWPQLMHGAIEGAVAAGAALVYADDLYAYGLPRGALAEDQPAAARGPKGLTRAIVAGMLMEVHHSSKLRAAIGRASDLYGPGVTASFAGEQVFGRAVAGRSARLLGAADAPHTYTFVDDFARALVTLGERDEAFGEVWHVPGAPPVTQRRFVELVYEAAGQPARMRVLPRWLVRVAGRFSAPLREVEELLYTVEQPFVVDHGRYERAFGADVTPLEEGIRQTVDWYRSRTRAGRGAAERNRSVAA